MQWRSSMQWQSSLQRSESPLANVTHSVIHCVMSKGDSMVFTDTVLEAGAPQRVRSRLKISVLLASVFASKVCTVSGKSWFVDS